LLVQARLERPEVVDRRQRVYVQRCSALLEDCGTGALQRLWVLRQRRHPPALKANMSLRPWRGV
jgi:hypothetical protein